MLIVLSTRNMSACAWSGLRDRAHGAWELASVGTSGLAIVATKVARYTPEHWWLEVAVTVWLAALDIYGLMTWLDPVGAASRTDRDLGDGFEPDTWILMGRLGHCDIGRRQHPQPAPHWLTGPVLVVTVVTWVVATLWIPPLIYFGLHQISHRPGNAALRRCGGRSSSRWACTPRPVTPWQPRSNSVRW